MSSNTLIALTLTLTLTILLSSTTPSSAWTPSPTPPTSSSGGKCPIDALKLAVCADVLGGLINVSIGRPPKEPCCSLISDLVDLEAAVCVCTAIKLNLLGINLDIPVDLTLLLNYCGKQCPSGFQCS